MDTRPLVVASMAVVAAATLLDLLPLGLRTTCTALLLATLPTGLYVFVSTVLRFLRLYAYALLLDRCSRKHLCQRSLLVAARDFLHSLVPTIGLLFFVLSGVSPGITAHGVTIQGSSASDPAATCSLDAVACILPQSQTTALRRMVGNVRTKQPYERTLIASSITTSFNHIGARIIGPMTQSSGSVAT